MLNKLSAFTSKVMNPPKKAPPPQPKAVGAQVKDGFCAATPEASTLTAKSRLGAITGGILQEAISASKKLLGTDEPMELSEAGAAEYDKLDPAQQARFDEVYEATAGNPAARAALESLLESGTLTGSMTETEPPQTLLDVLHETATTTDYQHGYSAEQVLAQTLEGLANPSGDGQDVDDQTCPGRAILHLVVSASPAEYARYMQELARDGRVERPGEEPLEMQSEPGADLHHELTRAMADSDAPAGEVNENGERVLKVTLMGKEFTINLGAGMRAKNFTDELNRNVPDVNYQPAYLDPTASPDSPETQAAVELANESIENGGLVYVKVVDGETSHWIPIDDIDADGNATYVDANGDTQTVPADELFADADALAIDTHTVETIPAGYQTPPEGGDSPGTGFPNGSTNQSDLGRKGKL